MRKTRGHVALYTYYIGSRLRRRYYNIVLLRARAIVEEDTRGLGEEYVFEELSNFSVNCFFISASSPSLVLRAEVRAHVPVGRYALWVSRAAFVR